MVQAPENDVGADSVRDVPPASTELSEIDRGQSPLLHSNVGRITLARYAPYGSGSGAEVVLQQADRVAPAHPEIALPVHDRQRFAQ